MVCCGVRRVHHLYLFYRVIGRFLIGCIGHASDVFIGGFRGGFDLWFVRPEFCGVISGSRHFAFLVVTATGSSFNTNIDIGASFYANAGSGARGKAVWPVC